MRRVVMAAVLSLVFPLFSPAQEAEKKPEESKEPVVRLPEMVTREKKEAKPAPRDVTASATVITREEFADRPATLPEVLSDTVGVHVKSYGGLDSFATLSVRGSTGEQVKVYLDGIELNRAQGGAVDLSRIPLDLVDHIELYRGTSPLGYGAGGIGGVVDIRTRAPKEQTAQYLSATAGSFGTFAGAYLVTGPVVDSRFLFGYSHRQTQGNFRFRDDNGTPFNQRDDRTVTRKNNASREDDILIKVDHEAGGGHHIGATTDIYLREQGVPGLGSNQSTDAKLESQRMLGSLGWNKPGFLHPEVDAEVRIFASLQEDHFRDPAGHGQIGVGVQDNTYLAYGYGLNTLWSFYSLKNNRIHLFGEVKNERFEPKSRLRPEVSDLSDERQSFAVGLSDEIHLFHDRLILVPAGRYDQHLDRFQGFTVPQSSSRETKEFRALTGKVGARYRIRDNLELRASTGQYYRPPNFSELFGDRGSMLGNPDLDPEKGVNSDVGLIYSESRFGPVEQLRLEYDFYYNQVLDLIQFVQTSRATVRAENVEEAQILGHEVQGMVNFRDWVLLSANYTYQEARNRTEAAGLKGSLLPGRPVHEAHGHVELFRAFGKVYYDVNYLAGNYLDMYNYYLVDARLIQNAGLTYYRRNWSVGVEVKNFTDNQISDVAQYPLPGRSYFIKGEVKF